MALTIVVIGISNSEKWLSVGVYNKYDNDFKKSQSIYSKYNKKLKFKFSTSS